MIGQRSGGGGIICRDRGHRDTRESPIDQNYRKSGDDMFQKFCVVELAMDRKEIKPLTQDETNSAIARDSVSTTP